MSHSTSPSTRSGAAVPPSDAEGGTRELVISGLVLFAAVMLVIDGLLSVLRGIMAIAEDPVFRATSDYVFRFSLTGWGVIHLVIGVLAVLVGLALFTGALWARVAGILLAGLNMIANFLVLPYYPFWSFVLLAADVLVIWALASYRPEAYAVPPVR